MLDYTRLTPAVNQAATVALRSFPAHYDVNDVRQELWVWVMENKPTIVRVLSDPESTVAAVVPLLVKAASSFLKTEDAAVYGYEEEDRFYYSVDLIKKILEVTFRHEDWQSFASALDAMPRVKKDPSQGGNNLASYADVKSAVEKLPEDQYNAVVWRYKYSYTQQQVGEEVGMTREGARQLLDRAYNAIQRSLGEQPLSELRSGYDGRQQSRGTASGVAQVERDYNG